MALDGLKMIHIAGYDGDPEECFEALGGEFGLLTTGTGSGGIPTVTVTPTITPTTPTITIVPPGSSLPIAPILQLDDREWLEKALEESSPILDVMMGYIQGKAPEIDAIEGGGAESSRSIQNSRALGAIIPVITSVAGWAKMLPAILKGGAGITLFLNFLNEIVKDVEDIIDPLDPGWRLLGIENVLKKALLTPDKESALIQLQSILDQRLADLAYVDETVDFGFCRVHIKGKMIEY